MGENGIGKVEREPVNQSTAVSMAQLLHGDLQHYDEQAHFELIGQEVFAHRSPMWDDGFNVQTGIGARAFKTRELLRIGWDRYVSSSSHNANRTREDMRRHRVVKNNFGRDEFSEDDARRFLRRLVFGIVYQEGKDIYLDVVNAGVKKIVEREKVRVGAENFGLTDVCKLILEDQLSLSAASYVKKKKK